jgi:hypothetical protein
MAKKPEGNTNTVTTVSPFFYATCLLSSSGSCNWILASLLYDIAVLLLIIQKKKTTTTGRIDML